MTSRSRRFLRNAVLALIPAVATPLPAFADLCRNPDVKVINEKVYAMEITKIKDFDACNNTWRTENVDRQQILPGAWFTFTDDLEYVEVCYPSVSALSASVRRRGLDVNHLGQPADPL